MIRTGIFGGSFNPVHIGHLELAKALLTKDLVDEIWLMVSPQNPLKEQKELLDENTRLELTRKAAEAVPRVSVSDFEFHLPRPSFMWNTLKNLSATYPDRRFHLIIGADNWLRFPQWRNAEAIYRHYPLIIYPREGYSVEELPLPDDAQSITFATDLPLFPVSSTEIRRMIRAGEDVSACLPAGVAEEIRTRGLYREE